MSRIKELKQHPDNNINVVDIISLICPDGKPKYVETLLRLVKNSNNMDRFIEEVKKELVTTYNIKPEDIENKTTFQTIFIYRFLDSMFEVEDVEIYQKFCEFNERNLIPNNDLTTYKDFEQIKDATNFAALKVEDKEMESQIVKLFEDKEWLVLRPLTYRSSRKYGANTKWCTTQENQPQHFKRYTSDGILIYNINKITGHKVAFYTDLKGLDFGFWSQTDEKIDSMLAGLPFAILELIQNEVKTNNVTNRYLLSDEQKMKEEAFLVKMGLKDKKISGINSTRNEASYEMPQYKDEVGDSDDDEVMAKSEITLETANMFRNQERALREERLYGISNKDAGLEEEDTRGDGEQPSGVDGDHHSLKGVIKELNRPMGIEKALSSKDSFSEHIYPSE